MDTTPRTCSRIGFAGLLALSLLTACASAPERPAELTTAESRLSALEQDPTATRFAGEDLRAAQNAIQRADAAFTDGADAETVAHYVTVAEQRLSIAETRRDLGMIRNAIDDAGTARNDMILLAREQEANQARLQARAAQQELLQARADAEELAAQIAELQMQQSERGLVLTLGDILFDFDSAGLKPGGERTVQKLAEFLAEHADRQVLVEGFTDAVGSEDYNQQLSRQRADAVVAALIGAGVDRQRVEARGYGEQHPVANNDTEAGRQQNRRVEVVIGDPGAMVQERTAT